MPVQDDSGKVWPRRPTFKNSVMFDVSNGVERVRAWPKKRGRPKSNKTRQQNALFTECSWAIKFLPGILHAQAIQATKGTPLLPRDILMQQMFGRFCAVKLPDGRRIYPMAARQDISESLDILSQVPGTILVRGPEFWYGLEPGDPGDVLSIDSGTGLPAYILNSAVGSLVVIEEQELAAAAASIVFDNIPQTNRDLIMTVSGRTTAAGNNNNGTVRFNNDSGAHYDYSAWFRTGSTNLTNQTSARLMGTLGATHITDDFAQVEMILHRYARTDRTKHAYCMESLDLSTPDIYGASTSINWKQTAAVDRIDIFPGGGNWAIGTIATLYGRG